MKKKSVKKPKSKAKKKVNNYTKQKYPALNAKYQVGNRRELIDYDYLDKLSAKELEWLDSFTAETVITNFNHKGKQLITDKEEKRELYRDNNRRNKDLFSISKSSGNLKYGYKANKDAPEDSKNQHQSVHDEAKHDQEDYMLTLMALKKVIKNQEDET